MDGSVSPRSYVARVREITDEGCRLYIEYPSGMTATVDSATPYELSVDDIVLVRAEDDFLEPAPAELWPDEPWVGIVRLRLDDVTVVNQNGNLRLLKTSDAEYEEANTVEARDSVGVVRVLADEPLPFLEMRDRENADTDSFESSPDEELSFEDFGGLEGIVQRARELVEVPLEHQDRLKEIGARPIKGVLFTGEPGTGKTMLARIIANQAKAAFFEISGPEVFSKWYGESGSILRRLFNEAASKDRAIIFFDEIDSVAGHRDEGAHEESRRVVAQLLTLMDGFKSNNVVVVATTNRPQDIDIALRRPGRFDWEIEFPMPDESDRTEILRVSAARLKTGDQLPHDQVAAMTAGWSAADLAAIWSEAALLAVADERSKILVEDYLAGYSRVAAGRLRSAGESRQPESEVKVK